MFDADRQMLQRVASATKLIPSKLAEVIGERAFGPLLCARLTGLLEPSRAVDVAAKLPTPFLADLAVALDPRRASRVIAEIPPRQIAEITRLLAEREEFIAMGGFVGHLSEAALRAAIDVVSDEALLRTAYVVESRAASARSSRRCTPTGWSRSSRRRTPRGCGSRRSTSCATSTSASAASSGTSPPGRPTRSSTG